MPKQIDNLESSPAASISPLEVHELQCRAAGALQLACETRAQTSFNMGSIDQLIDHVVDAKDRFDRLDARIATINARFDAAEARMRKAAASLEAIGSRQDISDSRRARAEVLKQRVAAGIARVSIDRAAVDRLKSRFEVSKERSVALLIHLNDLKTRTQSFLDHSIASIDGLETVVDVLNDCINATQGDPYSLFEDASQN